jgi:hypothetical protein
MAYRRCKMPEIEVGRVSDFFARSMVVGVELTHPLKVGNRLHILGHTTDLELELASMQINRVPVREATAGASVGIEVPERVRPGDYVYLVMP